MFYLLVIWFIITIIGYSKFNSNTIIVYTWIKIYLLYWIILFNHLLSYYFINLFIIIDIYIINSRFNSLSLIIVYIVLLVSSFVIYNSIDYLSIIDSYLFIIYILLFQFIMIIFILSNHLLLLYFNWDLLGLISYLLINYWCNKINCGIKAIIYNRLGDLSLIYLFSIYYSFYSIVGYYAFTSLSLCIILITFTTWYLTQLIYIVIALLLILFTKSSQFPFSSWLLNAMNAPTPISSLLHSSTMVIAGVYLGIILQDILVLMLHSLYFLIPVLTLITSVLKAVIISDIKSIIALSTISQLSYMFIAILINPLLCIFHIIIHAIFKSLLFIIAGSIIHYTLNYQSVYKIEINNNKVIILFILSSFTLVLSISKELIILSSIIQLQLSMWFIFLSCGAVCTIVYIFKILSLLINYHIFLYLYIHS